MNSNPYIGLSSYEEKDLEDHKFVGRSKEINDLFSLIDNEILTTLYGRSGIGKTSLLQAGVLPALRNCNYKPILCRFGDTDNYFNDIKTKIENECGVKLKDDYKDDNPKNLVEYLTYNCFYGKANTDDIVTPILIFDQFEDVLRMMQNKPDDGKYRCKQLLNDIHVLSSPTFNRRFDKNYRFVISIREDFLYMLEDAIDEYSYREFKNNRYRLLPLSDDDADEIIELGFSDQSLKDKLKALSTSAGHISTNILSLYCYELFEKTGGKNDKDALAELGNETKLIESYYLRCKKPLSKNTIKYIEDNLQKDGLRRPVKAVEVEKNIPEKERDILFGKKGNIDDNNKNDSSHKLLQYFPVGGDQYIELVHDKIAEVINAKRVEVDRKRWKILARAALLMVFAAFLYVGIYFKIKMKIHLALNQSI